MASERKEPSTIEIARHLEFRLVGYKDREKSVELATNIKASAKRAGLSSAEYVYNALLNACQAGAGLVGDALSFDSIPLDDYDGKSEAELVNLALSDTTLLELAKKCLVTEAKRRYQGNKATNRDGSERLRDTADGVQSKLHALATAQMLVNDKAQNWWEKRAINTSWLQKGGKEDEYARTTGEQNIYGFQSVKVYLDVHADAIQAHHDKHGIKGNWNQKVSNKLKQLAKGE